MGTPIPKQDSQFASVEDLNAQTTEPVLVPPQPKQQKQGIKKDTATIQSQS